ncbi:S41 family peptidase [Spirosoma sp. KCTC 42546]|uniref:S41 family peptidase n=1 Tax=Spirosoma sp. KCTC 42546 TaxID=2520506 RepID=UPI001159539D|nr:S41 family peptidase [Spirosoma sp. KCTC 42546]QDK81528.1 S41 family peptidase [Spirosoma sp. KCTC 42546]
MKNIPLFMLLLLTTACTSQLIGPQTPNSPVTNFDYLWQEYDRLYGTFEPKKIDWDTAYKTYRPQITEQTTDADLYRVMTKMLDILDDNHVYLRPTADTKLPWYSGGILGRTQVEDYNGDVVKTYLTSTKQITHEFVCSKIKQNVGYILLKGFENDFSTYEKTMDSVLTYLADTKGIIIDLRDNGGGEDRVAQYIANRFATERHLSFTSRMRTGPKHADFAPELKFYTEPAGRFQYTKPVVVVTNLSAYSSAETFMLAMLQNKQVTQIGEVTGGAFSDALPRDLPNGWSFRVPIADVRDASGQSLEGIGIMPKIRIKNTPEELKAGHDRALERAIELLE